MVSSEQEDNPQRKVYVFILGEPPLGKRVDRPHDKHSFAHHTGLASDNHIHSCGYTIGRRIGSKRCFRLNATGKIKRDTLFNLSSQIKQFV